MERNKRRGGSSGRKGVVGFSGKKRKREGFGVKKRRVRIGGRLAKV